MLDINDGTAPSQYRGNDLAKAHPAADLLQRPSRTCACGNAKAADKPRCEECEERGKVTNT